MHDKTLGILGGMGPEATAYYYTQLIQRTQVTKDQDHFHVVVEANAKIPDRTQAILHQKESPLPELLKSIDRLNRLSVDSGFITCITSHYFFKDLEAHAQFKLYNAIEETYRLLQEMGIRKVGLLATSGTVKMNLFQKVFKDIEIVIPDEKSQEDWVMDSIYSPSHGIKSGHRDGLAITQLKQAGQLLIQQGAQALIGGCTEVSMVLSSKDFTVPFIDPMLATIDRIIQTHP